MSNIAFWHELTATVANDLRDATAQHWGQGGNAVLAGGAIRDAYLGFEPKDYDVYVTARPVPFPGAGTLTTPEMVVEHLSENLEWSEIEVRTPDETVPLGGYGDDTAIFMVVNALWKDEHVVQIIVLKPEWNPGDYIRLRFDNQLNQGRYDARGGLVLPSGFVTSLLHREIKMNVVNVKTRRRAFDWLERHDLLDTWTVTDNGVPVERPRADEVDPVVVAQTGRAVFFDEIEAAFP